jgi:hypothetical protein
MTVEVLEERGGLRVIMEYDQDPEEPYDEGASPLLRIDLSAGSTHVDHGNWNRAATDRRVENAVSHWQTTPSDRDWRLFEKYLRAYLGVTKVETWRSGSYWYVTYDPAAWREELGAPEGSIGLEEYRAWCEGETYCWQVQKQVTWSAANYDYLEYPDRVTWEPVDSCGGYYGYEYAAEEAREAFKDALTEPGGEEAVNHDTVREQTGEDA